MLLLDGTQLVTEVVVVEEQSRAPCSTSSSTKPSQPSVKLEDLFYVKEDYQRIEDENDLTIKAMQDCMKSRKALIH